MIKQLILVIQLLGLFFYQLIFTGDLTVTQKVPDSMTQGKETLIEITIKKEDVTGFAKVQQVFPAGFTAEPVDTKGATFSFKDNKVKFIWMALPVENEFTISYKVTPNASTQGEFTLGGKFSFIADSERKNIDIPVSTFSVSVEDLVVETPTEEAPVKEAVPEVPVEVIPVAEIPSVIAEKVSVGIKRTIEDQKEGLYQVTLIINKSNVQGFAKISEKIPSGFTAEEGDSKGAIFSFKEGEAKMLWMALPRTDSFSVSYLLKANEQTANGNYNVKGVFSFLENEVTSKYDTENSTFELNVEALVVEEVSKEELAPEEPVIVMPPKEELVEVLASNDPAEESIVTEVLEKKNDLVVPLEKEVTTTPSPENGVTYKIQVGAGHKTVSNNYFALKFKLKDKVSTINHEGWIKYLVGSYDGYKAARDKRNAVRNNVKRAFVTAYNSNLRITVQEALMISNQKWYK